MALTVRTNGSGSSNQITAQWFNDYHDLLTGIMQDQEVSIKNNLVLVAIGAAPSAAMTGSAVSGGSMGVGVYVYTYTFVSPDGESTESPTFSVTTTSSNKKVSLASIATGPTGTTARNLYRTVVGGSQRKYLTQIADNVTTGYSDAAADGTLGANAPTTPSFGGALIIKDSTGAVKFQINNDGSFSAGGTTGFGNTRVNGTLTVTGVTSLDNGAILSNGAGAIGINGIITANGGINTNTLRDNTHGNTALDMSAGTGDVSMPHALSLVGSLKLTAKKLQDSSGNNLADWSNAGLYLLGNPSTNGLLTYRGDGVDTDWRFFGRSAFSGTGSVTVNHGLKYLGAGLTPQAIVITQGINAAGSQTQGCNSTGATQTSVVSGASNAWTAVASAS